MMKLWKRLVSFVSPGHAPSSGCRARVEFTGAPPCNPSEDVLEKASAGRKSVGLPWLEEQMAEVLYREALRRGGWLLDIGIWGPAAYREEASRIVADIRPQFGYVTKEGKQLAAAHNEAESVGMRC